MNRDFKDKVIYITGGTAGIGFATAKLCLEKGATVVVTGRNIERLEKAKLDLATVSSSVIAHNVDVSNESEVTKSLNEIFHDQKEALPNLSQEKRDSFHAEKIYPSHSYHLHEENHLLIDTLLEYLLHLQKI